VVWILTYFAPKSIRIFETQLKKWSPNLFFNSEYVCGR
jgi:hypothetical protein